MTLPMLTRIKAQNLLSFGPEGIDLELPALTVLIGPNGSGKSNLLETVGLLHAAPRDLAAPIREGGGIRNWIWQGQKNETKAAAILADQICGYADGPVQHKIEVEEISQSFRVSSESVRFTWKVLSGESPEYIWDRDSIGAVRQSLAGGIERKAEQRQVAEDKSLLSEIKDGVHFPELEAISSFYD